MSFFLSYGQETWFQEDSIFTTRERLQDIIENYIVYLSYCVKDGRWFK